MESIKEMEAQALKKYKVALFWKYVSYKTVFAQSPEEAAKSVVEGGYGRDAGSVGPELAGVQVQESSFAEKDKGEDSPAAAPGPAPLIQVAS
jgi:hypothetical protein